MHKLVFHLACLFLSTLLIAQNLAVETSPDTELSEKATVVVEEVPVKTELTESEVLDLDQSPADSPEAEKAEDGNKVSDVQIFEHLLLGGSTKKSTAREIDEESVKPSLQPKAEPRTSLWSLMANVLLFLALFGGVAWYSSRFLKRMSARWNTAGTEGGETITLVARHILGQGQSLIVVRYRGEEHLIAWSAQTVSLVRTYTSNGGEEGREEKTSSEPNLPKELENLLKKGD